MFAQVQTIACCSEDFDIGMIRCGRFGVLAVNVRTAKRLEGGRWIRKLDRLRKSNERFSMALDVCLGGSLVVDGDSFFTGRAQAISDVACWDRGNSGISVQAGSVGGIWREA